MLDVRTLRLATIITTVVGAILPGCKRKSPVSETKFFDVLDFPPNAIAKMDIFNPEYKICLIDKRNDKDKTFTMGSVAELLQFAIDEWTAPVKAFEPDVIKKIRILTETDGCQRVAPDQADNRDLASMTVTLEDESDGNRLGAYWIHSGNIVIYKHREADKNLKWTVLHEMGHAFGLSDTYAGVSGFCKFGQPKSVMCGPGAGDALMDRITEDDINGVQFSFCRFHENNDKYRYACQQILARLKPGPVPNLDDSGQGRYKLGVQASASACSYKSCFVVEAGNRRSYRLPSYYIPSRDNCEAVYERFNPQYLKAPYQVGTERNIHAGYRVSNVVPGGIAALAGIQEGDVLLRLSGSADGSPIVRFDGGSVAALAGDLVNPKPAPPVVSSQNPLEEADNYLKFVRSGESVQVDVCRNPQQNGSGEPTVPYMINLRFRP